MGRKMLWPDKIIAALPKGSLDAISSTLAKGESKTDFLREAVRREIERRSGRPFGPGLVEAARQARAIARGGAAGAEGDSTARASGPDDPASR